MSSAGAEAVDLLAAASRPPDPWQADALHVALGEDETGMWAASEVGLIVPRQNGKGDVLMGKGLHSLYLTPVKQILWSAHEFKTTRQMFLRVQETIDGCYDLRKRVKTIRTSHGEESVELNDRSTLYFVARSRGSGRGFSPEELLLDESFALTDEQVSAQMPATAAQANAQIWYASSHPLIMSLVLRRLCKRGRAGSEGLAYIEYGSDKKLAREDREAWAQANPNYPDRLTERSMLRLLGAMDAGDFDREMLGLVELDDEAEWVIDAEVWKATADPASRIVGRRAFSVDITPDRKRVSIGAAGRRADGRNHIEVAEQHDATGGVVARLVELAQKWDPVCLTLDPAGMAGSLIKALNEKGFVTEPKKRGQRQLQLLSAREAAQAHGAFVDGFENDESRHFDQAPLNKALAGAGTRPLAEAKAWSRKDSSVDISPLVATTNAQFGFATYGVTPEPEKRKPQFARA